MTVKKRDHVHQLFPRERRPMWTCEGIEYMACMT